MEDNDNGPSDRGDDNNCPKNRRLSFGGRLPSLANLPVFKRPSHNSQHTSVDLTEPANMNTFNEQVDLQDRRPKVFPSGGANSQRYATWGINKSAKINEDEVQRGKRETAERALNLGFLKKTECDSLNNSKTINSPPENYWAAGVKDTSKSSLAQPLEVSEIPRHTLDISNKQDVNFSNWINDSVGQIQGAFLDASPVESSHAQVREEIEDDETSMLFSESHAQVREEVEDDGTSILVSKSQQRKKGQYTGEYGTRFDGPLIGGGHYQTKSDSSLASADQEDCLIYQRQNGFTAEGGFAGTPGLAEGLPLFANMVENHHARASVGIHNKINERSSGGDVPAGINFDHYQLDSDPNAIFGLSEEEIEDFLDECAAAMLPTEESVLNNTPAASFDSATLQRQYAANGYHYHNHQPDFTLVPQPQITDPMEVDNSSEPSPNQTEQGLITQDSEGGSKAPPDSNNRPPRSLTNEEFKYACSAYLAWLFGTPTTPKGTGREPPCADFLAPDVKVWLANSIYKGRWVRDVKEALDSNLPSGLPYREEFDPKTFNEVLGYNPLVKNLTVEQEENEAKRCSEAATDIFGLENVGRNVEMFVSPPPKSPLSIKNAGREEYDSLMSQEELEARLDDSKFYENSEKNMAMKDPHVGDNIIVPLVKDMETAAAIDEDDEDDDNDSVSRYFAQYDEISLIPTSPQEAEPPKSKDLMGHLVSADHHEAVEKNDSGSRPASPIQGRVIEYSKNQSTYESRLEAGRMRIPLESNTSSELDNPRGGYRSELDQATSRNVNTGTESSKNNSIIDRAMKEIEFRSNDSKRTKRDGEAPPSSSSVKPTWGYAANFAVVIPSATAPVNPPSSSQHQNASSLYQRQQRNGNNNAFGPSFGSEPMPQEYSRAPVYPDMPYGYEHPAQAAYSSFSGAGYGHGFNGLQAPAAFTFAQGDMRDMRAPGDRRDRNQSRSTKQMRGQTRTEIPILQRPENFHTTQGVAPSASPGSTISQSSPGTLTPNRPGAPHMSPGHSPIAFSLPPKPNFSSSRGDTPAAPTRSPDSVDDTPIKLNLFPSTTPQNLREYAEADFRTTRGRDAAANRLDTAIKTRADFRGLMEVADLVPKGTKLKVSGPAGKNVLGKLKEIFPKTKFKVFIR